MYFKFIYFNSVLKIPANLNFKNGATINFNTLIKLIL